MRIIKEFHKIKNENSFEDTYIARIMVKNDKDINQVIFKTEGLKRQNRGSIDDFELTKQETDCIVNFNDMTGDSEIAILRTGDGKYFECAIENVVNSIVEKYKPIKFVKENFSDVPNIVTIHLG